MNLPNPPLTHIVGAGLIGSSLGLGLRAEGWTVTISDTDPNTERLSRAMGAGAAPDADTQHPDPDLVIVAVPPSAAAAEVVAALQRWPHAVVTDVASVKLPVAQAVHDAGLESRYVGSHPMAGREIAGAVSAQGDLFKARPWVVCRNGATDSAVALVHAVANALQADVVELDAARHDGVVARVSHAPQVAASAVAASLGTLSEDDVALAGQGLRDVTRIAASSAAMWADIAQMNATALRGTLDHIIADLTAVRDATDIGLALTDVMNRGRSEVARIPGKHGGATRDWAPVTVLVPDQPGQLLRLLTDIADLGINIEDLSIEQSPRQPVGLTTVWVMPERGDELTAALGAQGWEIAAS